MSHGETSWNELLVWTHKILSYVCWILTYYPQLKEEKPDEVARFFAFEEELYPNTPTREQFEELVQIVRVLGVIIDE